MTKEFKNNLGFDIGTSKVRIFKEGKLLTEAPSKLIYEGNVLDKLIVKGKIANFNATQLLILDEIKKIQKPLLGLLHTKFTSLVSVPSDSNEVAIRTFRDTMELAGAQNCLMLYDCFIGAVGLGININNTTSTIVDLGAGKTSISTINGFVIKKNSIFDISGISFDEAIQAYLSRVYELLIDIKEAERLKIEYVDFRKSNSVNREIQITGIDKNKTTSKVISIQSKELTESIRTDAELLLEKIQRHIDMLESSDSEKLKSTGIYLIGGGFKLKGLIELIAEKINVSSKSYNTSSDFMKIGFEKIQSNPEELYEVMIR